MLVFPSQLKLDVFMKNYTGHLYSRSCVYSRTVATAYLMYSPSPIDSLVSCVGAGPLSGERRIDSKKEK